MSMNRVVWPSIILAFAGCSSSSVTPSRPQVPTGDIDAVLAGPQRTAPDKARDAYRHPKETLAFFGVTPHSNVVELWPGGGWYTAVLAPLLRDGGKLTVTNFDPQKAQGEQKEFAVSFEKRLAAWPEVYGKVVVQHIHPPDDIALGPDGSADVVLTFRSFHGWINNNIEKNVALAAFKVLKSGGVFGVVEHRGDPGEDEKTIKDSGYVPEQRIVDTLQAAGFKLDAKSDINANAKDDHKHESGVWALPPTLRNGEKDKDKYMAIGESDRQTLRFVKP